MQLDHQGTETMNDSRTRTILALGAAAFLALAATGCDPDVDQANTTPESKSFGFSGDSLTVKSNSADLHLIASDVDDVEVERRVSGTKIGGEIAAGWQFDGGILTLSVDCDGVSVNCHAQYTVKVPRDVAVTAEYGNSDVQLSNLGGAALHLEGHDGTVRGEGISATSVSVVSRNGDTDLDLTSVPDRVDVRSQDGNVRLGLPASAYAVRTAAKKGDVTVDVADDSTSSHSVNVQTRNGDIRISEGESS
ncbi:DUF4097 family beta strand repeat-containing protein [Streptomyces anulatus]|uniref:DUF4097 family beta strand repeat-containing protein n=1 Tax=Streptomyces anulatus TaxID=1892 RepID=UPI001F172512|nr:DUF4097 family beta strand repeat-containing protein [Streptomyces anulatus]WTC67913.1 DUF4097 domain-containing protein [Streptomyces anulatus]